MGILPAVRASAVQINQDVPRLRALARAHNAAIFQFVHDARGASVAEPEPPLASFLTAPDLTPEGLIKAWRDAPAALGVFSARGAPAR